MSDTDQSVFVVVINDADNKVMDQITAKVQGKQEPLCNVSTFTNTELIKKVMKYYNWWVNSLLSTKESSSIHSLNRTAQDFDFLKVFNITNTTEYSYEDFIFTNHHCACLWQFVW